MSDGLLIQTMQGIFARLDQIDDIKAEIKEEYAQAKAAGYDKTALGAAIREIRGRDKAQTPAAEERAAIVDLYVSTFDNAPRTYVHVPAREGTTQNTPERPSNRDVSAVDKSSSEAGPQAEASLAGTGSETLAGREGRTEEHPGSRPEMGVRTAQPIPSPAADEPIKGLAAANAIAARAAQPAAPKAERGDIDIEIPAFLRRTCGGNHPSFGEQA